MTIFRFSLLRSLRNKGTMLLLIAVPFLVILLPSMDWPTMPIGYHYYGVFLLFIAAKLVHLIMEDRSSGTTLRISASPVTHLNYLFQNLLAFSLLLVLQCIIVVIGGQFVYREQLPSPFALILIYTIFTMTAIGFSLAWCSIFRTKETSLAIMFGVIILMTMLGGIMWPVQIMPVALQKAAMLMPTYWYMEAMQVSLLGGNAWDLTIALVMLVLFMLAFLIFGSSRSIH